MSKQQTQITMSLPSYLADWIRHLAEQTGEPEADILAALLQDSYVGHGGNVCEHLRREDKLVSASFPVDEVMHEWILDTTEQYAITEEKAVSALLAEAFSHLARINPRHLTQRIQGALERIRKGPCPTCGTLTIYRGFPRSLPPGPWYDEPIR